VLARDVIGFGAELLLPFGFGFVDLSHGFTVPTYMLAADRPSPLLPVGKRRAEAGRKAIRNAWAGDSPGNGKIIGSEAA
jgi:hypothetical protein